MRKIFGIIVLALVCGLFSGCPEPYIEKPVIIEEIDMASNLAPTYGSVAYYGPGSAINSNKCIDDDISTSAEVNYTGDPGSYTGYFEITLSSAFPVETIYMNALASAVTGICSGYLQYYDESTGSWVTLNSTFSGSTAKHAIFTYTVNKTIKRVRIGYNGDIGKHGGSLHLLVYEVMINGDAWQSSRIKVKTSSGVVTLAREPTLSSPLRYRKGGVTYSLVLVNPTDPSASPVRVKTASGIKAIAKM